MSELIAELKREHSRITGMLREVLQLGVNSDAGRKRLYTAKAYLLAHLNKEDGRLYPLLREAALHNDRLRHVLANCADEMDAISKKALFFFDHYAEGGDEQAFTQDFKQLFRMLNERILREETEIYSLYDDLVRQHEKNG